ncbi:hypothetical protein Taro_020177 [Colocasia esculenta]|uniref:At2g23090-like zinc-binding domain-containing protein n=1 Tax=Colocasia esculenta TaxID=4460 RepID=A0A843UYY3_COLES|nr:hypothetical protein [Colocasia esculenta]
MGGGNGQKSRMAREKNLEKMKAPKGRQAPPPPPPSARVLYFICSVRGSQLETNKKAMNIQCKVCMQTFMCTTSEVKCKEHAEAKHPKSDLSTCFPHLKN